MAVTMFSEVKQGKILSEEAYLYTVNVVQHKLVTMGYQQYFNKSSCFLYFTVNQNLSLSCGNSGGVQGEALGKSHPHFKVPSSELI